VTQVDQKMGLKDWIKEFAGLHEHARMGVLSMPERQQYLHAREELASALLAAQRHELKGGQMARQSLRVQRTMQIDLALDGAENIRAMTLDLSIGGFAAMIGQNPEVGTHAKVTFKMPKGDVPLETTGHVVNVREHNSIYRVSFAFEAMNSDARERMSFLVFDTVLETFKA
jgi:c-di-GMP-binding flagellar brake protein YcgR